MRKWENTLYLLLVALLLSGCMSASREGLIVSPSGSQATPLLSPFTMTPAPTHLSATATLTRSVTLSNPSPTKTTRPTQTISVEPTVTPVISTTALAPPFKFLKLEELTTDVEIRYIAWEANGLGLIYALIRPEARSTEPKDWAWWHYDLETGEKVPFPSPVSRVTQETRQKLDLCPTDQSPLVTRPNCPDHSVLLESSISERIVFSPLNGNDTWLGNIDGTNLIKLETPIESPSNAQWSSDNRWLLLSVHFPGMPGQMTHYLVHADGSFENEFSALTNHDLFLLNGLFPQFSPDGTSLAYVGSTVYDSFEASDYHLYLLDLENLESHLLSNRIGLFQWSADGSGLYVLDNGLFPMNPYEDTTEMRKTELYFIDVTTRPGEENIIATDIPYYPNTSSGTWLWGYSSSAQALAYVGYERFEFGILLLAPTQGVK